MINSLQTEKNLLWLVIFLIKINSKYAQIKVKCNMNKYNIFKNVQGYFFYQ